jgi:hypothetical protein
MVFMGHHLYLRTSIGSNSAIESIKPRNSHCFFDLAHPALSCSDADGLLKVSEMRRQLSYAKRNAFFLPELPPLWTPYQGK